MELSAYDLALIAGAFTIVGALIGAVIAYCHLMGSLLDFTPPNRLTFPVA